MNAMFSSHAAPRGCARWFRWCGGLGFAALASIAVGQAQLDPDPEIFDGGDPLPDVSEEQPEKMVDDWEQGPSVVIITSTANLADIPMGSGEGLGGGMPGMGGMGMGGASPLPSIPSPMSVGMGGGPQIQQGNQPAPAASPGQQGQRGDPKGAAASASAPSPVSIGDPSKQIATRAQGQAGNIAAPADAGEPGAQEAGEDSTEMPEVGHGTPQTRTRGGGVEEGDAMDPTQM